MRGVLPDLLFHPDHVIPVPELVAAVVELARHGIAHMFMKPDAVQGQIVILFSGYPMQAFRLKIFWALETVSRAV